ACIARDGDARDALDRFGEVEIREVGDVLGDDRIDRGSGSALDVERGFETGAESGDHHLVDRFLILRRVLGERRAGATAACGEQVRDGPANRYRTMPRER